MSTTPQTDAQRLADWLDADACDLSTPREAAAELRRLDTLSDERGRNLAKLIMLASEMQDMLDWLKTERDQLRAQVKQAELERDEAQAKCQEMSAQLVEAERNEDAWRAQLSKAVAEEREACAELMEQQHTWITNIAASAAIRARRTP